MPTHKDFKRLVRGRMQKTGESYTSARANLLKPQPAPPPPPPDYARIAGMSDDAVKAATGCAWARWVGALDGVQADTWTHREIATYIHEKYKVSDWWAQTVTVGYERIKGLRAIGQRRGGTYEATKSRALPVPLADLYRAWSEPRRLRKWLPGVRLQIRKATPEKSVRITWPDGTSVETWFTRKGDAKAQVQVQHRKLPTKEAAEAMKAWWEERLDALATLLGGGRALPRPVSSRIVSRRNESGEVLPWRPPRHPSSWSA
jgi:uncharacterized protein YndB with AHSA1/START domain